MVDQQAVEGHWNELAGYIKQRWKQLNDLELQRVKGDLQGLVSLIREKTGWDREKVETELDTLVARGVSMANQATDAARGFAQDAGGRVQQSCDRAEQVVQRRPTESVAVAFGAGLIAGLVIGLVVRSR